MVEEESATTTDKTVQIFTVKLEHKDSMGHIWSGLQEWKVKKVCAFKANSLVKIWVWIAHIHYIEHRKTSIAKWHIVKSTKLC